MKQSKRKKKSRAVGKGNAGNHGEKVGEDEVRAAQPVSAQVVGNAFVQQYYHILHHSPALVYRFYQDISKLSRPEEDGSMSITTTMQAINDKIVSLNYGDFIAEIKSVDAQDSFNGGVHVLVTGYLTGKDSKVSNFAQTFFLAPQDKGYFVLNDIFRYVNVALNPPLVSDVTVPIAAEPVPAPVQVNHVSEQNTPSEEEAVSQYHLESNSAVTASSNGEKEYLYEKVRLQNKMAREADEKANKDIFAARDKNIENMITIDLHGQHIKQAMKILKLHLLFGAYVRSVRSFRVITGFGSHGVGKSKLKNSVLNLLQKEGIACSEENRGTLLIQLNGQTDFSFLDSDSDCD